MVIFGNIFEGGIWVFEVKMGVGALRCNDLVRQAHHLGKMGKIKVQPNALVAFENIRKRLKIFEK